MSKQDSFLKTLKAQAKHQSKLQDTSPFPKFLYPVMTVVGEYPWQTLIVSAFFSSWILLLIWFEFFYNLVQNIAK